MKSGIKEKLERIFLFARNKKIIKKEKEQEIFGAFWTSFKPKTFWLEKPESKKYMGFGIIVLFLVLQLVLILGYRPLLFGILIQTSLVGVLIWSIKDFLNMQNKSKDLLNMQKRIKDFLKRHISIFLAIGALLIAIYAQQLITVQLLWGYILFCLGALVLWTSHFSSKSKDLSGRIPDKTYPLQAWEPWFVLLLIIGSLAVLLYHLGDRPQGCAQQEGELLSAYFQWLENKPFALSTKDASSMYQPTLTVYQATGLAKLFGFTTSVLRIPSVFYGWISLLAFYFVCRRITSPLSAAIASVLYCASHLYMILSRTFFPYTILLFPIVMAFGFLLITKAKPRWYVYMLAGAALGFSFHGYLPGRGAFLIFVVWIGVLVLFRQARHITFKGHLLFWLGFLITSSPTLIDMVLSWEANWKYVKSNADPYHGKAATALYLYINNFCELLPKYAKIFHVCSENNYQYHLPYKPLLDKMSGLLFGLGLFLCIFKIWRPINSFLILFLVICFLPAMFSSGHVQPYTPDCSPHPVTRRICMALPAVYLILAVALEYLHNVFRKLTSKVIKVIIIVLLCIGLMYTMQKGLKYYFSDFAKNPAVLAAYYHKQYWAGQEMRKYKNAQVKIQQNYFWELDPHSFLFPRDVKYTRAWSIGNLLVMEEKEDCLLILEPYMEPTLPFFKKHFPHAKITIFKEERTDWPECKMEFYHQVGTSPFNPYVYCISVYIPKEDIKRFRGLWDTTKSDEPIKREIFNPEFSVKHSNKYMKLAGAIIQTTPGEYFVDCDWKNWRIKINSKEVSWQTSIYLNGGVNYIEIEGKVPLNKKEGIPLKVIFNNQDIVPKGQVVPILKTSGIKVEYFTGDNNWSQSPKVTCQEIFPMKRFYYIYSGGPWYVKGPVFTRISSTVLVPEEGEYMFKILDDGAARLYIDGQEIFNNFADSQKGNIKTIYLRKNIKYNFKAQFKVSGRLTNMTFLVYTKKPNEDEWKWAPFEWFK